MELSPITALPECSNCGCSCSLINNLSARATWNRTVKRKIDEIECDSDAVARVEVENECGALREALSSQQETIQELHVELEEERNASASAANEAMAMILRLQREKAEVAMESRQFKRYAEEKIAHDEQEILALEDTVVKTEEVIQSLLKKLYTRLEMLEADRESMKQAIVSMRTEKAQLVILKELAQQLYRDMSPERKMPVRKSSLVGTFSVMSALKWIVSLVFWKTKAQRSKYMFDLSASNVGLLLLLDKNPHRRQWRCLTRAQM